MKNDLARPTIMLSAGMALSGTSGLFSVMSGQPTFNVVFFRCLFGVVVLFAWVCFRGGRSDYLHIARRQWPLILVSGLCLVINWLALFEAFNRTSIGFATIIYHLQPFWIVLIAGLFLGETLSRDKLGWIAIAFVGLILTILPRIGAMQADRNWLIGVGLAVVASLFYAATTLTTRAVKSVKPDVLSTLHCMIGLIAFAPFMRTATLTGGLPMWGWLAGLDHAHARCRAGAHPVGWTGRQSRLATAVRLSGAKPKLTVSAIMNFACSERDCRARPRRFQRCG
jgi:drug/metabolite transporter (DMT)-like permease